MNRLLIFYFLFFSRILLSESSLVLGVIDSDESKDMTVVTMRLNQQPEWKNVSVEEFGDYLQVMLPDTIVAQPGAFIDGKGPYLSKIAPYETEDKKAIVRIFLKDIKGSDIIKSTQVELLDKRIILTIDHNSLPKIKSDILDIKLTEEKKEESKSNINTFFAILNNVKIDFLSYGAMIGIAISLIFLGFLTLKRVIRNKRIYSSFNTTNEQRIKISSQIDLALKQKISVIHVGDERFLIGHSNDHIQLLTKLEPEITLAKKIQNETISHQQRKQISNQNNEFENKKNTQEQNLIKEFKQKKVEEKKNQEINSPLKKENSNRISYRIDDQGITKTKTDEAIKDVTQIIREKLKSLPKI